jgi:hypothetical protein
LTQAFFFRTGLPACVARRASTTNLDLSQNFIPQSGTMNLVTGFCIFKDDVNGLFSISDIFLHGLNIQAGIRRVYCPRNEEFSTNIFI